MGALFGLISAFVLAALSIMMLGDQLAGQKKNEQFEKLHGKIKEFEGLLAYWGFFYGLVALVLGTSSEGHITSMIMQFIGNIMIMMIALPYAFEKMVTQFKLTNPAILEEVQGMLAKIKAQAKYISMGGCAVAGILLLAALRII